MGLRQSIGLDRETMETLAGGALGALLQQLLEPVLGPSAPDCMCRWCDQSNRPEAEDGAFGPDVIEIIRKRVFFTLTRLVGDLMFGFAVTDAVAREIATVLTKARYVSFSRSKPFASSLEMADAIYPEDAIPRPQS